VNNVNNIGNLVRDPELRMTSNGNPVCDMRVAINYGKNSKPVFFDVTVFGDDAENCAAHLSTGREVGISGRLAYDEWTNDNGDKRSKLYVIANHVDYLRGKRAEADSEDRELAAAGATDSNDN